MGLKFPLAFLHALHSNFWSEIACPNLLSNLTCHSTTIANGPIELRLDLWVKVSNCGVTWSIHVKHSSIYKSLLQHGTHRYLSFSALLQHVYLNLPFQHLTTYWRTPSSNPLTTCPTASIHWNLPSWSITQVILNFFNPNKEVSSYRNLFRSS